MMGLVGSTLTGPLMFILPPLFFIKLCYLKSQIATRSNWKNNSINKQNGALHSNGNQNGGHSRDSQNGGQSNLPLLLTSNYRYETFSNYTEIGERGTPGSSVKFHDIIFALTVMIMGITTTVIATYTSWSNSLTYATFSPPCLINSTAAARSFLQMPQSF